MPSISSIIGSGNRSASGGPNGRAPCARRRCPSEGVFINKAPLRDTFHYDDELCTVLRAQVHQWRLAQFLATAPLLSHCWETPNGTPSEPLPRRVSVYP